MQYTSITDMMAYYNTGKAFSIVYITYDRKKGSGGAVKEIAQASKHYQPNTSAINVSVTSIARKPNHFSNSTINIRIPGTPVQIRKVHVQLIRRFNGATVK